MSTATPLNQLTYWNAEYIAMQRDSLDQREVADARAEDSAESDSTKAGRKILLCHSWIRSAIDDIRFARLGMGKKLSKRGMAVIEDYIANIGDKTPRFRAQEKEIEAAKRLANNLEYKKSLWCEYRRSEQVENDISKSMRYAAHVNHFLSMVA